MASKDTQFKKGNKAGKGRKKGSKNKVSKRVLNAIYKSLEDADESLKLLKDEDLATYWRIVAAQIPKDLDINNSGNISVTVVHYSEDDEYQPVNVAQRNEKKLNGDGGACLDGLSKS